MDSSASKSEGTPESVLSRGVAEGPAGVISAGPPAGDGPEVSGDSADLEELYLS